jgi:hypothetical protein
MVRVPRKSYHVSVGQDGTYNVRVTEDFITRTIRGFATLDQALDECARLNALEEEERSRREKASDI